MYKVRKKSRNGDRPSACMEAASSLASQLAQKMGPAVLSVMLVMQAIHEGEQTC